MDRHSVEANPPAEERTDRGIAEIRELVSVLQKELPLLREEQLIPAEVRHLLVDIHLREIGVHGQVQVERRTERHLPVHSDVPPGGQRRVRLVVPADPAERIRNHRDVGARRGRRLVPDQDTGQRQRRGRELAPNRGPRRLLRGLQVQPAEVDAPPGDAVLITDALERNRNLQLIAILVSLHRGGPSVVPTQVGLAPFVEQAVPLRPGGIHSESETVGLVVEGVQEEDEVVVLAERPVPLQRLHHVGPRNAAVIADRAQVQTGGRRRPCEHRSALSPGPCPSAGPSRNRPPPRPSPTLVRARCRRSRSAMARDGCATGKLRSALAPHRRIRKRGRPRSRSRGSLLPLPAEAAARPPPISAGRPGSAPFDGDVTASST